VNTKPLKLNELALQKESLNNVSQKSAKNSRGLKVAENEKSRGTHGRENPFGNKSFRYYCANKQLLGKHNG